VSRGAVSEDQADGASVVIPTYNRRQTIDAVVRAVLADPATRELIVVVDGCADGSFERLCELAGEDPRLRPLWQENAGEPAARQAGVEAATKQVVVLLDDDVLAEPGLVAGHLAHHRAGGRQVVLGYMPVPLRPGWPEGVIGAIYGAAYEECCRIYETDPHEVVTNLWAGNMSLPRADALEVGLEPPGQRFKYHGDRDLGLRLLKAGFTGTFDRSLRASHLYTRSLEGFRRDCLGSGQDTWLLHELHGDLLGAFSTEPWIDGLPSGRRALATWARRPGASVIVDALSLLATAAGRIGARRAALRALELVGVMLRQRGALEASRRP
jgi:glycosyltransferase involved in cell wall biosynthesis